MFMYLCANNGYLYTNFEQIYTGRCARHKLRKRENLLKVLKLMPSE